MTDVVVAGAAGRMGSRIVACLQGDADLKLVAAIEAVGHAACGNDAGEAAGDRLQLFHSLDVAFQRFAPRSGTVTSPATMRLTSASCRRPSASAFVQHSRSSLRELREISC